MFNIFQNFNRWAPVFTNTCSDVVMFHKRNKQYLSYFSALFFIYSNGILLHLPFYYLSKIIAT